MVAVSAKTMSTTEPKRRWMTRIMLAVSGTAVVVWLYLTTSTRDESMVVLPMAKDESIIETVDASTALHHPLCPVTSIASLSKEERQPRAGMRHMVDPPAGGNLTLVCCETTKGHFSALLHHAWAPLGVARLVNMIQSRYFSSKVPLFRCTNACQFGLSGNPEETKNFNARMQDDPMWLPPGKDHRKNEFGVLRYPQGIWTYAGSGPNTRSNQFVITLKPNPFMGGGSPWEVPLGEFVGKISFDVLPRLYNGYGEKGPGQGLLRKEGNSERVQKEWPLMDYILGCDVLDEIGETLRQ